MNIISNELKIRVNDVESDFLVEDVRSGKHVLSKSKDCVTEGNGQFDIL